MAQSVVNISYVIRSLIKYAVNNLHRLLFDENGNVIWKEPAQVLMQIVDDKELTDEEYQVAIIYAIEPYIMTKSYEELDQAILSLPLSIRMILSTAEGAAKTFLIGNKKLLYELVTDWDEIIIGAFSGDLEYLKPAIENAPNLRKWLLGYITKRLNIKVEDIQSYARKKGSRGNRQAASRKEVQQSPQAEGLSEQDRGQQSP